jgi:isopropylmalate/homocitrate/citramalate synthase
MNRTINLDRTLMDGEQRAAFRNAVDEMGMTFTDSSSFERAFSRTKQAASRNDGAVTGAQLQAIVDEAESGMEIFRGVADSFR